MSFAIEWKPTVRKQIRRLDPVIRRRVIEAVANLGLDPRPVGSVILAGSPSWRRIRVGDYRVIYEIQDEALVVLVLRVGSRGDVYRHLRD